METKLFPVMKHRNDPIKEPERWGYIDQHGKIVIDYRFDQGGPFDDGVARVVLDGHATYIDESGAPLLDGSYEKIGGFAEGRGVVRRAQKSGYINKEGALAIDLRYEDGRPFAEGLAAVRLGGKWGYIDISGAELIPPRFDEATSFSEGLAAVRIGEQWSFTDRAGDVISEPCFAFARQFSGGLAAVEMQGKFGYVDRACSMRIEPQFDLAREFHEGLASVGMRHGPGTMSFVWNFIATSGQKAFPLEFYDPVGARFSEGLAGIDLGHRRVYCDKTGATKIESARFTSKDGRNAVRCTMTSTGTFRSGIAEVILKPSYYTDPTKALGSDHMAYIDRAGEVVWGSLR